jgi:4-hydroxybenzoate polyprenyltransferase
VHPIKRTRPIASGRVSQPVVISLAALLLVASLAIAITCGPAFVTVLALYCGLMVAYCLGLKQVVLLDIFVISAGFLLRMIGGAAACDIKLSAWLLLATTLAALWLSIEKRINEVNLLDKLACDHRKSLTHYTRDLTRQLQSIITPSLVMTYALYSFHSQHGQTMLITVPFVLFGIMRYQFIAMNSQLTGTPEQALLKDGPLRVSFLLWLLACAAVVNKVVPALPLK